MRETFKNRIFLSERLIILFVLLLNIFIYILFTFLLTFKIQIITLLITMLIFVAILLLFRVYKYGLSDFILIFLIIFSIYNTLVLLNFTITSKFNILEIELYPLKFNIDDLGNACLLIFLALLGFIFGIFLSSKLIKNEKKEILEIKSLDLKLIIFLSIFFYIIGIIMYFYSYRDLGGFIQSLRYGRLERYQMLMSAHSLPYTGFLFLSLILLFFVSFYYKRKKILFVSIFLLILWLILLILQGDRRFSVFSLLIIFVEWSIIYYDKVIKRVKFKKLIFFILLGIIVYVGFSFFSQVRVLIPYIINRRLSIKDSINWVSQHFSIDWFLPGKTEFGGTFLTLLYSIKYQKNIIYGSSYLSSILNILPRSLYPGIKPPLIPDVFAIKIHNEFYSTTIIKGWGYNPIAEVYNNFGIIGIIPFFMVLSIIFSLLNNLRYRNFWSFIIYLLIIPATINLNRTCFASVIQEVVYNLIPFFIFFVFYQILYKIKENKSS